MKKLLIIFLLFANFIFVYGQVSPAPTPVLRFSYDRAGNQILRQLVFDTRSQTFTKSFAIEETKVYPNPTLGLFNVSFDKETLSKAKLIRIYNLNGQLVLEQPIEKEKDVYEIDIQNQPKGLYLVSIELFNKKYLIKKLIKK